MPVIGSKKPLLARFNSLVRPCVSIDPFLVGATVAVLGLIGGLGDVTYRDISRDVRNNEYREQTKSSLVEAFNNKKETIVDARGNEWRVMGKIQDDGATTVEGYEIITRTLDGKPATIAAKPTHTITTPAPGPAHAPR